jgi:hypothetical protein
MTADRGGIIGRPPRRLDPHRIAGRGREKLVKLHWQRHVSPLPYVARGAVMAIMPTGVSHVTLPRGESEPTGLRIKAC